jgi:hypothetical protein
MQMFHMATGYAATNNPCEIFNSSLKRFAQRRLWNMKLLLEKLGDFIESEKIAGPVPSNYVPTPTSDVNEAARKMLLSERVEVFDTAVPQSVRVRQINPRDTSADDNVEAEATASFTAALDRVMGEDSVESDNDLEPAREDQASEDETLLRAYQGNVSSEDGKNKGVELYKTAIKWTLWRYHRVGMPLEGWLIDLDTSSCHCKYFKKFKMCAHVVVARHVRNMGEIGRTKKLKDRRLTKAKINAGKQAGPSTASRNVTRRRRSGNGVAVSERASESPGELVPSGGHVHQVIDRLENYVQPTTDRANTTNHSAYAPITQPLSA